jgi:hypothetical protein
MDTQGKEIATGNAAKIAAELVELSVVHQVPTETVDALFDHYLERVSARLIAVSEQNAPAFDPTAALAAAFPGSTFVPQPAVAEPAAPTYVAPPSAPAPTAPSAFVPAAAAPAAQPAFVPQGPAPIPGASTGNSQKAAEALEGWTLFFQDIQNGTYAQNWEDVRAQKKGPKSPDFKHRSWKRAGSKFTVGLWIDAKENPDFVRPQLAQLGIA